MIVDAAPVNASAMNVKDIVVAYAKTIVPYKYQEVVSEISVQQNAYSFNDLLSVGIIGSRVIEFLNENTEEITAAKSCKPSFVLAEQENFMNSVHNSNLTQFMDAWTMLNFYTSNFPQLQKYSQFCNAQKQTPLHVMLTSKLHYRNKELQKMHDSAKPLIFRRLLQENSIIDIHAQDTLGATAMHYAAQGCRVSVIKMLKKAGANVNTQDKKGNYPLHYVIAGYVIAGSSSNAAPAIETIETLVFLGARINAKNYESYHDGYARVIDFTPLKYTEITAVHPDIRSIIRDLGGNK